MNWTLFSKERPKEEPNRNVLVAFDIENSNAVFQTKDVNGWPKSVTHWAGIEPPDPLGLVQPSLADRVSMLEQRVHELMTRNTNIGEYATKKDESEAVKEMREFLANPPTPDPFEEWLKREPVKPFAVESVKMRQRRAWDAAIKWKEGK